ncbi:MAG: hypothetical protein WKF50_04040 [Nocardioides sp.]
MGCGGGIAEMFARQLASPRPLAEPLRRGVDQVVRAYAGPASTLRTFDQEA